MSQCRSWIHQPLRSKVDVLFASFVIQSGISDRDIKALLLALKELVFDRRVLGVHAYNPAKVVRKVLRGVSGGMLKPYDYKCVSVLLNRILDAGAAFTLVHGDVSDVKDLELVYALPLQYPRSL